MCYAACTYVELEAWTGSSVNWNWIWHSRARESIATWWRWSAAVGCALSICGRVALVYFHVEMQSWSASSFFRTTSQTHKIPKSYKSVLQKQTTPKRRTNLLQSASSTKNTGLFGSNTGGQRSAAAGEQFTNDAKLQLRLTGSNCKPDGHVSNVATLAIQRIKWTQDPATADWENCWVGSHAKHSTFSAQSHFWALWWNINGAGQVSRTVDTPLGPHTWYALHAVGSLWKKPGGRPVHGPTVWALMALSKTHAPIIW